jgi:solute carrier family 25 carnitine/acylcarnitine transporter 20/29
MYNGMWDCVVKTVKYEGLFGGLYKGMSAPLVGVTPIFALSFLGNDLGRKIQESHPGENKNVVYFLDHTNTTNQVFTIFLRQKF